MGRIKIKDNLIILLFVVYYTLLFFIFYPPFYGSPDEHNYLRNAYLLREGNLVVNDPLKSYGNFFNREGFVSKYNLGTSLILIPFTFFGWKATFLYGLIMHIAGLYFFMKIMKELKYQQIYSLFYFLFPPFIYFSRTLLSEIASVALILGATYFYLKNSKPHSILSGIFFGLAVLVRYSNILIFTGFMIICLFKNYRKLISTLLSFLPFLLIIMLINISLYGGILNSGYTLSGETEMFIQKIPFRILLYFGAVAILYPLMLISIFTYKNRLKFEFLASSIFIVLFYSAVHISGFQLRLADLIQGTRYLMPILPFFIISYIPFFEKLSKSFSLNPKIAAIIIFVLIAITIPFFSSIHNNFLSARYDLMNSISKTIPENSTVLGVDDDFMFFMEPLNSLRLISIDRDRAEINNNTIHYNIRGIANYKSVYLLDNSSYIIFIEKMRSKKIENITFERDYSKTFALLESLNNQMSFRNYGYYNLFIYKIRVN